jgi:hypothetical protein
VAHTPEQRDHNALCGAKKKNGETCRAFAGQGTAHYGIGRCKFHLGNTKGHQVHAVKQEAKERAIKFGESIHIEPTEALLAVLHLSAGHLRWIKDEVAATTDNDSFDARVLMRMFDDERDRVARIAKAAIDAGVAERQVRLAEEYGELLAGLLRRIFDDRDLGLTTKQRAQLPDVLRRHLSALDTRSALVA